MKGRITRNFKWFIGVSAVLVLMAAVPTTSEAGRRWSGADPEIIINGEKMNVTVYWETEHTCDIRGPIDVVVAVPHNAKYEFQYESSEKFDCDGDGDYDTKITTKTEIREHRGKEVIVGAKVNAPRAKFRTALGIEKNDELVEKCKGVSNRWFRCDGIRF